MEIIEHNETTPVEEVKEDEYCKFLLGSEEKIRGFLLKFLHEAIKLYGDIAPKIKREDRWYGVDDLWILIAKLNSLRSRRESMMGIEYYVDEAQNLKPELIEFLKASNETDIKSE